MSLTAHHVKFQNLPSDPASPGEGWVWYNSTDNMLRKFDGTTVIDLCPPGGRILKITANDTTTDLDSTTRQPFDEAFGVVTEDTSPGSYSVSLTNAQIRINNPGLYKVTGYISFLSGVVGVSQRTNLALSFDRNGNLESPIYQNNYSRDATGHNEVSQGIDWIVRCNAGDILQLFRQLVSGQTGGQITIQSTNSYVAVERIAD